MYSIEAFIPWAVPLRFRLPHCIQTLGVVNYYLTLHYIIALKRYICTCTQDSRRSHRIVSTIYMYSVGFLSALCERPNYADDVMRLVLETGACNILASYYIVCRNHSAHDIDVLFDWKGEVHFSRRNVLASQPSNVC